MPTLHNLDENLLIASRLRICSSARDRTRGLIGTRHLDDDEAVWIHACNSIHSFFMTMTIDVAFLDEDLRVVKLFPRFTPWRLCLPVRGAVSVLEGPVGMIRRGRLHPGTRVRIGDGDQAESGVAVGFTSRIG